MPRTRPADVEAYRAWLRAYDAGNDVDVGDHALDGSPRRPMLSVVLFPDGPISSSAADRTLESLLRQSYPRWEAWVQPGSSHQGDPRIRLIEPDMAQTSRAHRFDRVVATADGEYLIPLVPGTRLLPRALLEIVNVISASEGVDVVFTDEDALDEAGSRLAPQFKPAWDPELALGRDFVGDVVAIRTQRVRDLGGADPGLASAEALVYDLVLRVAAMPDSKSTRHIPIVLCTRPLDIEQANVLDGSTARRIVAAHLARRGQADARVVPTPKNPSWTRVVWPVPTPAPLVSVIVPTRDQPILLLRCAEGILARTDYPSLELLIVDNGSTNPEAHRAMHDLESDARVRVLRHDRPFNFSELNNAAAREASGEILVLLNDDTEVIDGGWLRELVSQALRPEIGAVGARLLYPDHTIQHAGIVLEAGRPHHQYRRADASELGAIGELALTRSVSAVTAACVALRKSVFDEVNGMDESLAVAFGDVDLCLRITEHGYRVICTPFAELNHHESSSRGYEDTAAKKARLGRELSLLRARWGERLQVDRFANPNLIFTWDEKGSWGLPRRAGHRSMRWGLPGIAQSRAGSMARDIVRWVRARATIVVPNPLFSSTWYLASYPEVASYRPGPYRHYRRHGVSEGRNPNPYFDTLWYLDHYPDVAARFQDPVDHYLRHGASEGRDPGPRFSTSAYLAAHPDVRTAGENPLLHRLRREGW